MFWAIGVGHIPGFELSDGTHKKDEFNIMFRLWIKAFPNMAMNVK